MNKKRRPKVIRVHLSCTNDFVPEDEVDFIDITEDFQGRDLMTFTCPKCGKEHKSFRFG